MRVLSPHALVRAAFGGALLFLGAAVSSAQIFVSTGGSSGLRMYYPGSNDWWLDPSQGRFDLRVNGGVTPLLSVLSGGNVGIGTLSPSYTLQVQGDILSGLGAGQGIRLHDDGVNSYITPGQNRGTGALSIYASGGLGAMTILQGGQIGIGTTNPTYAFQVAGGSIAITSPYNALVFDSPLRYIQGTRSGADYLTIAEHSYAMGIQLGFSNAAASGYPFYPTMTIVSASGAAGHIGIGTTNPGATLQVQSDAGSSGYALNVSSQNGAALLNVQGNGNVGIGGGMSVSGATALSGLITYGSTNEYVSAQQALPAAPASIEVAHGWGAVPAFFQVVLLNTIANCGYAVGDEVKMPSYAVSGTVGTSVYANTSVIGFREGGTPVISNKTSGADCSITVGDWVAILSAHR